MKLKENLLKVEPKDKCINKREWIRKVQHTNNRSCRKTKWKKGRKCQRNNTRRNIPQLKVSKVVELSF